jgi:rhamnogalacturonan endolyase
MLLPDPVTATPTTLLYPMRIILALPPFASALVAAFGLVFAGDASAQILDAPAVTLADHGDHVTFGNGIVSFAITKANGDIDALKYGSTSILAEPGYLDWVSGGNNHIANGSFAVVSDPAGNGGEMAEASITRKYAGQGSPFDVELHYVLRRGESGPYCFVVFHHAKEYPAGSIAQARWVLRLDDEVFDFINVDEQRRMEMPPANTPTQMLGPKESLMFTEGPFKGMVTDKYHFFVDAGDHFVHGWISTQKRIGCWVVYGSTESQNGGPTKQHNTAHFGRMLFKILTCGHYGSGSGLDLAAGEEWRKIYGPWMLYFNSGGDRDALWADAKKEAGVQQAGWPPAWMHDPEFPLAGARGAVRGRLHISDPQDASASPANAWVGLAAPDPDWQKQGKGYQFWVHAARDGSFAIPNVRAGVYTLYAFTDGVMDEFRRDGVRVTAGGAVNLGALEWKPVRYGTQLWQIGTPDRTAKEFRHGDDYREWGLWQKFPVDFPNGVNFVIGQSKERTDWNYAQVNVQQNGQWVGTTWHILFDLAQPPKMGTAVLRLALASGHNAKVSVDVNGQAVGGFRTAGDNAMIRAGIHGQYSEEDIAFDAALLKAGRNSIGLAQSAAGNAQKSLMYDCVRLEVDDTHAFDKTKIKPRQRAAAPMGGDSGD